MGLGQAQVDLGIIRVDAPAQMLETLKFLSVSGIPKGRRVAAFTCSGGDAAMVAVKAARNIAANYPLMPAMKQIEAWRTGDTNWTRMAPPLVELTGQQQANLKADLAALGEPAAAE